MMSRASLYILIVLILGRIHEIFKVLAPLRPVLLVGGVCVVSTLLASSAKRQPALAHREVRLVLAMGALAFMFLPFGVWPSGSLQYLMRSSWEFVLLVLVIALAVDPAAIRGTVMAALTGEGLLGLFTLASVAPAIAQGHAGMRASASAMFDSNDVAMMMVLTLPLAALGAVAFRGARRFIAAGVAAICVLATVATVSRGGLVGLAVVSALLVYRLRSVGGRLLIGMVIALLLAAAPSGYWNRMGTIFSSSGTDYDERGVATRVEVWQRGLDLFLRNPVTGVGIGQFENAAGALYGRNGGWRAAHNSFIQIAVELGILGLVLFIGLLSTSIRSVRQTQRAASKEPALRDLQWIAGAIEIALYGYVVVGLALSQAYASILYFLVGVAVALRLEVERRQRSLTLVHGTPGAFVEQGVPWWHPRPAGAA